MPPFGSRKLHQLLVISFFFKFTSPVDQPIHMCLDTLYMHSRRYTDCLHASRPHVNYLCLFLVIAVDKLEQCTCMFFLIYACLKTLSSIDLFVFNCIRNSINDYIPDVDSEDPSIQVLANLA